MQEQNNITLEAKNSLAKVVIITAISLLFILGCGGALLLYCSTLPFKNLQKNMVKLSSTSVELAENVTAELQVQCPWGWHPKKVTLDCAEGTVVSGEPTIKWISFGYKGTIWKIDAALRPFRLGAIGAGKLTVAFTPLIFNDKHELREFSVPAFQVTPRDVSREAGLRVAGKLSDKSTFDYGFKTWAWIILSITLIFCLVLLLGYLKRKRTNVKLAIWELALIDLEELRSELKRGVISLDGCFIKLTDIIKKYVEKRFNIKAQQQTTYEFLSGLDKNGSKLPVTYKPFMKDFLEAADLVKFANLPADEKVLGQALDKAEILINETAEITDNIETEDKG